ENATALSQLQLDVLSRVMSQSPDLYTSIQIDNPEFGKLLKNLKASLSKASRLVETKDGAGYSRMFEKTKEKLKPILKESFEESRELISVIFANKTSYALLGPTGSFSEAALNFHDSDGRKIFLDSFEEITKAVAGGVTDYGVIPIENSIGGGLGEALDLIYEQKLLIAKVIVLPISHCLAALKKSSKIDILLSHPQSFLQTSEYVANNLPNARKVEMLSNSAAFEKIAKEGLTNAGAIGPKLAAAQYGLEVVADHIENNQNNMTRFAVVARRDSVKEVSGAKTSIVVIPKKDRPGLLVEILQRLASNKINLCKIESRPSKEKLGVYVFHLELDGNPTQPNVKKALNKISEFTEVVSLGSYDQVSLGH
ncbi:MAG TPA: prephenate dehydratase, partial [bacterium]|nr:prephenate dehydratase [bacterium]